MGRISVHSKCQLPSDRSSSTGIPSVSPQINCIARFGEFGRKQVKNHTHQTELVQRNSVADGWSTNFTSSLAVTPTKPT